jgi:hypothetical protein
MNYRLFSSALVVFAVAGVVGCSERRTPLDPSGSQTVGRSGVGLAKPDSIPPKPPPIPIVQFAGASDARPGEVSITRWLLGNDRNQAQTITWRLTDDAGWSSLPQSGSVVVPKNGTQLLEVAVAVPDSTVPGFYPVHMAATLRHDTATADGVIHVTGQDSIPSDSLRIGGRPTHR